MEPVQQFIDPNAAAPAADASWQYDQTAQPAAANGVDETQTGQFIPTTGQTNGGGPMRRGGGASRGLAKNMRFNPMGGRRAGPQGDSAVSAANAEKNELGYIIFAYNIGYNTQENQLYSMFAAYGTVAKVNVIQDFARGQGKGYGFVTMPNQEEAEAAVTALNGTDFDGNSLQIRFKQPKGAGGGAPRGGRGGGMRGGPRGGFGGMRGGGMRGGMGGGFRGGRGMRGGGMRGGRGRGGGFPQPGFGYADQTGYADPYAAGYAAAADPYAAAPVDPYTGFAAPAQGYAAAPYGQQW